MRRKWKDTKVEELPRTYKGLVSSDKNFGLF